MTRLRAGRTVGNTLYAQRGIRPAKGDPLVGVTRTPEIAAAAVSAVNDGKPVGGAVWWHSGGLVYDAPAAHLTGDWIIAVFDPDLAREIATAARGGP